MLSWNTSKLLCMNDWTIKTKLLLLNVVTFIVFLSFADKYLGGAKSVWLKRPNPQGRVWQKATGQRQ